MFGSQIIELSSLPKLQNRIPGFSIQLCLFLYPSKSHETQVDIFLVILLTVVHWRPAHELTTELQVLSTASECGFKHG